MKNTATQVSLMSASPRRSRVRHIERMKYILNTYTAVRQTEWTDLYDERSVREGAAGAHRAQQGRGPGRAGGRAGGARTGRLHQVRGRRGARVRGTGTGDAGRPALRTRLGLGWDLLDQRGQAGLVEQVSRADGLVVGYVVERGPHVGDLHSGERRPGQA